MRDRLPVCKKRYRAMFVALSGETETGTVLRAALGFAQLVGASVEALHVTEDHHSSEAVAQAVSAAGIRLHERNGHVADQVLEALASPEAFGAVMGVRGFTSGPRPAGSAALAVLRATAKPVVFVPPEAAIADAYAPRRLVVPLDGSPEASNAFLHMESHFRSNAELEIAVLYAMNGLTPTMVDHPEHGLSDWGHEFLLRHCPGEHRTFDWRTGNPADAVIEMAEQARSDLIVVSFRGDIEVGHGAVVREVLARSVIPVLVLPVSRDARTEGRDDPRMGANGIRTNLDTKAR